MRGSFPRSFNSRRLVWEGCLRLPTMRGCAAQRVYGICCPTLQDLVHGRTCCGSAPGGNEEALVCESWTMPALIVQA